MKKKMCQPNQLTQKYVPFDFNIDVWNTLTISKLIFYFFNRHKNILTWPEELLFPCGFFYVPIPRSSKGCSNRVPVPLGRAGMGSPRWSWAGPLRPLSALKALTIIHLALNWGEESKEWNYGVLEAMCTFPLTQGLGPSQVWSTRARARSAWVERQRMICL